MRVLYVSLHRQQTFLEQQISASHQLSVLRLLNLPRKYRKFAQLPSKLASKLSSRYVGVDNLCVKYRSSALMELLVLSRYSSFSGLSDLSYWLLSKFFKMRIANLVKSHDLVIVPSDFWDFVEPRLRPMTLLEVRWITQEFIDSFRIPISPYMLSSTSLTKRTTPANKSELIAFGGLVTYSRVAKDSLEFLGIPKTEIFVHPLTNPSRTRNTNRTSSSSRQNFLYVGRSSPEKRLDIAVEVAQKMRVTIDVVGTFNEVTTIWLKKQPFVNYIGNIPHRELLDLMSVSFALLVPGLDSYGLAVDEALSQGTNVFATRYVGLTEWISDPRLHIVEHMNVDLFVRKILQQKKNEPAAPLHDITLLSKSLDSFLSRLHQSGTNSSLDSGF